METANVNSDLHGETGRTAIPAIAPDSIGEFWRSHDERWANPDFNEDPAALGKVCHAGAPEWVNRYAAACQERVFSRLFSGIPAPRRGARALDIGCGGGRWCQKLDNAGYKVVGIDLQPKLLERNRKEIPGVQFVYSSIQEYQDDPFDVVTSVTVIQHNPPTDQVAIARRIRSLLRDGGHALVMENCVDILPHVFAHDEQGWRHLFEANGFRCLRSIHYDYRFAQRFGRSAPRLPGGKAPDAGQATQARRAPSRIKRALVAVDRMLEPVMVGLRVPGSTHCGFLFVAE